MPPIDLGYRCREQFAPFHRRRQRWAALIAHRRAGKSVACVMDLVDAAMRCTTPGGRFAYVAPTYAQAKDVAWGYLKQYTAAIPGIVARESDLAVVMPHGARVRLYGADNYERLRGGYADGLVLDEYGDFDPRAWPEVLRPLLADRAGWATFIGTPKGKSSDLYRVWTQAAADPERWFSLMLKASETGILPASELADLRRELTADQYAQEMECSFDAAIQGAIYRDQLAAASAEGRICSVPYDPSVPVWTAWDLGIGDATAIWCGQIVGREVHLIDYYEGSGEAIPHYIEWLDKRPYRYASDILPHDAQAREKGTGKSVEDVMRANGRKVRIAPRLSVDEGINALRLLFPRLWIDATRCARGLEALGHYRRDYNARMQIYKSEPVHDWSSHGSDAARYLAIGLREQSARPTVQPRATIPRAGAGAWMAS